MSATETTYDMCNALLTLENAAVETYSQVIDKYDPEATGKVLERIRKLAQKGVIQGYEGRLAPKAVGLGLTAFIFVRSDEMVGAVETGRRLTEIPEAQEVHHVAGEDCYLVKLRARDTEDLGRLLRERFGAIPHVRSTRTTIVLGTLKESAQLPLTQLGGADGAAGPIPAALGCLAVAGVPQYREGQHVRRGVHRAVLG